MQYNSRNPEYKITKYLNKHFPKEDIRMAHRYMMRCSASIIIREMQIETIIRHYLTPLQTATIKHKKRSREQLLVRVQVPLAFPVGPIDLHPCWFGYGWKWATAGLSEEGRSRGLCHLEDTPNFRQCLSRR